MDNVNHPAHYAKGGVECIEAIKASMTRSGFAAFAKAMYWGEYNGWDIWQRTGSVTHWMPLPEPPK